MLMQHVKQANGSFILHIYNEQRDRGYVEVPVEDLNDLQNSGTKAEEANTADIEYALSYLQGKSNLSENDQAQIEFLQDGLG